MMAVSSLATKASLGDIAALDHLDDGQAELRGELPVALVVAGHAHDDAGAVAHEDVVGNEHGQGLVVTGFMTSMPSSRTPVFSLFSSPRSKSDLWAASS